MNTRRDPFNVVLGWTITACLTVLAMLTAITCPLAYCWFCGLLTCFGIGLGTIVIVGKMGPGACFFIGPDFISGAVEVIGAILSGLANASR